MAAGPLALLGVTVDKRTRSIAYPAIAFIGLISQLGHKEWRFIVYMVPIFNIAAARGAAWILERRRDWRLLKPILLIGVFGILAVNSAMTALLVSVSHMNYPGGEAMATLHAIVDVPKAVVFIDNLAAQSGASLFMQECAEPFGRFGIPPPAGCRWKYFKTWSDNYSSLITHSILEPSSDKGRNVLQIIQSVDRVGLRKQMSHVDGWLGWLGWLPTMTMKDALWVIEVS